MSAVAAVVVTTIENLSNKVTKAIFLHFLHSNVYLSWLTFQIQSSLSLQQI